MMFGIDLYSTDINMVVHQVLQELGERPMVKWDSTEVLNFVERSLKFKICPDKLHRFQCISGYIFKHMSLYEMQSLMNSTYIGQLIFDAKENHLKCHSSESPLYVSDAESCADLNIEEILPHETCDQIRIDKKPGRPRSKPFTNGHAKRSEKLWEFLLHLLQDDRTCPHLIKWENFEEGTFKFIQSSKVALLWGKRKNNENMTYEKFSRAMRYYYKSEVLLPVPGKRLVYKFGPKANGWNTVLPIY